MDEELGFHGVVEATTILYFGYLGFDFVTTMAEEAIDAKRNVPTAIMLSVISCMLIYGVVSFSVQGVGNLAAAGTGDGETALALVFEQRGLTSMSLLIFVCALLGITAAGLTNTMSQSRILYSYAKDGLFFEVFKEIDPDRKVPVKGSWLAMVPIATLAALMDLRTLAELCSLSNLFTFAFIDTAVVVLRLKGIDNEEKLETDLLRAELTEKLNTRVKQSQGCERLLAFAR
jgi:basic amino acid/polyamine antiporter, APA family